ncbi:MAG: glycosyltransferase family 39 protein [Clostridia bacterium]|nr:glycosyltransferase family 39 protein [Clostridia bacterium]
MINKLKGKSVFLILLAIIILGLAFRAVVFYKFLPNFKLAGDAKHYWLMSHQLVDNGIYGYWNEGMDVGPQKGEPNAFVTPVYPLFLSGIYAVFHDPYLQITIARMIQVGVSGLITPLLAFLLVRRLFRRNDIALLTSLLTAIYPTYAMSSVDILTEVFSLATMLLYFYLTTVGLQTRKAAMNVLAGIAFAFHILVRPPLLPLFILPFIYIYFAWGKKERKAVFRVFFQTCGGFVLLMLPWWIRNIVSLHTFIITSTSVGNPLLAGTYPYMENLMWDVTEQIRGNSERQAKLARERIINGFLTQPLLYIKWYTLGKIQIMFGTPWQYYKLPGTQIIHNIIHNTIVFVGAAGLIANSVINRVNRFINIYGLLFLGLYLIFIPLSRYAYQHMFFLMLSAAYLVCQVSDVVKHRFVHKINN